MRFLNPDVLWHLLWLVPLMIIVFVVSGHKTAAVLKSFLGKHADDPDYVLISKEKRLLRFAILLLAVIFLVGAAARPSWGVQIQEMHGQGRDLLFVFDTSKSMLAKDVQPSRLAHAKWLVRELVKLNPGDRFGLIAFAGRAFLECPLTSDKTSFIQAVDELSTESIPVGGTNIQAALETALQAFKAAETQHRAVVLITDGDELEGDSGKAVDEIIARKIPLFIAGIGDPSQPSIIQVPDGKGGFKTLKDAQGNIVNSPLNETSLGSLAKRTGGIYVRSTAGDPRLNALEKRIRALAPQDYESVKTTKPIDRFSYPLGIAFFLMLVWFALSERAVRNAATVAAMAAFLFTVLPADAQTLQGPVKTALPPQTQQAAPAQEQAVSEKEAEPQTDNPVELFNSGVEKQEKGDLASAVKNYEDALANGVDNIEIRGKASQNLGVITHTKARAELGGSLQSLQQQKLDEAQKKVEASLKVMDQAEEMYRESMREAEDHSGIAKNQSILLADRQRAEELKKKIEELKKMQQQAQQQTQQAKDQQKKENQQKQDQQKQDQNQQGKDQQKQDQNQQGKDQQKQDQNQQGKDQQKQDQNQQGKDQQKQDQNQQGKDQQKQDQQSAQQKTEQAKKSAEDLQKKAQELGQKNMEQSAEQAKKELEKAQQEQQKGNGESAEDHLKKALEKLGGDQNQKQDQQKDDKGDRNQKDKQDKSDQNKDKSDEQNKQDRQKPQPAQGGQPQQKEPEEGEIDKSQAASILEDMAKDEKNLRDAIKANQKQRYRNAVPAKDW